MGGSSKISEKMCAPPLMYVYTVLSAYKETYGNNPVWSQYRRNHKGAFPPRKTRKTCIVSKLIVEMHGINNVKRL
jgi:hypothetical protein